MNITEFLSDVRLATLRGTSLDAQAARAFVNAVRFIEQNYDLPYMRREVTESCTSAFVLTGVNAATLKTVQELRWFDGDGVKNRIHQIDPDQLVSRTLDDGARGYEFFTARDGGGNVTTTLQFDAAFTEATDVTLLGYFYSVVDLTAPSEQDNWLINNAHELVLARTMIGLAPIMRDPIVLQMYQQSWQENVGVLIGAASSLEQGSR